MTTIIGTAVVTGHTSGLGLNITSVLIAMGWRVYGISDGDFGVKDTDNLISIVADVKWMDELKAAAAEVGDHVDVLINCAGVNHLTPFAELKGEDWERLMDTNAKAPWMATQAFLPLLQRSNDREQGGTVINIVSNAAQVPMTHSLAYCASKAAALMVTRQMARELFKTHGLTIFSISPNKLAGTGMSLYIEEKVPGLRGWTKEEAEAYQLAALPIGEETNPMALAEFIGFLLSSKDRHRYLHGCNIPYGA